MTPTLSASLLALGLLVQSSPPTGAAGSVGAAGSGGVRAGDTTSGATVKKRGHDLADILLPLAGSQRRSGSFGPASPPERKNVRVNSPSGRAQWLPEIVVDPSDRLHLIGTALDARNDRAGAPQLNAAYYASFDGGKTWSEFLDTHSTPPWKANTTTVAIGSAGETYLFVGLQSSPWPQMFCGLSPDGGVTEPTWNDVHASGIEPDAAVDRTSGTHAGSVYVASVSYYFSEGDYFDVDVSASADGGQTWSHAAVDDVGADRVHGPSLAVDASGVVHVAFFDSGLGAIFSDSSSDGGATWGTDVPVASVQPFDIPHLRSGVIPVPRLAVDTSGGPFDGTLYVAWAQNGGSTGPDVVVARSTDHGATWSTPIPASDVTNNSQFTPAIDVDENGNVNVGFYDCRDDAGNRRVNLYVSRSSDGGATFQPNVKLSDVDFDPTSYGTGGRIVDRIGIAASDRTVHALWTDGRNGNDDVFTTSANLALFTDVSVISAATGGTVNFTLNSGPIFQFAEYHVLGSLSGTTPGTDFYFENVPVNYDLFTLATIYEANGPIFPGFTGTLDATGAATAQLVSGPLPPALIGVQMDFAALTRVGSAVRWGSAPTRVEIGN
jgi:hypothetical protein